MLKGTNCVRENITRSGDYWTQIAGDSFRWEWGSEDNSEGKGGERYKEYLDLFKKL